MHATTDTLNRIRLAARARLGIDDAEQDVDGPTTLDGKTVVVAGLLPKWHGQIADLIRRHGGRVAARVTRATDYVVAGCWPGTRGLAAERLGVTILSENQFLALVDAPALPRPSLFAPYAYPGE
jgi:DNA ligase (NAD+)